MQKNKKSTKAKSLKRKIDKRDEVQNLEETGSSQKRTKKKK